MTSRKSLDRDLLFSLLLIALTLLYAWRYVDFSNPPLEDAAMLMRYARNLAEGHGIVWNIGEPPVDGATDFLFMVASAALIKLGLTVEQSVRSLGFASHLLTVLIVYWTNRRIHNSNIPFALLSGLYLVVGTGLTYVAAYFGTPFFALAASSTWALGLLLVKKETPSIWLSLAFAFSGLTTALIRPEGVLLALWMLLAVILLRGLRRSMPIIGVFGSVFLVFGLAYFLWRWGYFGYPLPNPFYKKGAGGLHWYSLSASFANTLRLCLPFAVISILGFRSRETTKLTLAFLLPILGFASAFVLISNEMNFAARYQYALLPIVLMSWTPLLSGLDLSWPRRAEVRERGVYILALLALSASIIHYSWTQNCSLSGSISICQGSLERDGLYEVAQMLSEYRDQGYTLATTEAGLLPYYSGWTAIDTYGLNDPWIAHNGAVTPEYLDRYKPEVIMFHAHYSPLVPPKATASDLAEPWFAMTITLKTYAETNGYVLAAVFGDSPYDTHYYYVRTGFEDSDRLIRQISHMKAYYWAPSGQKAINYARYEQ